MSEKVSRRTIFGILSRFEHSLPKRKPGIGKVVKKLTKTKINKNHKDKISQRQAEKVSKVKLVNFF
jgi:hypothetical protein